MLKIIYNGVSGCLEQLFGVLCFCFIFALDPEALYAWYLDPWGPFKFVLIIFIVFLFCSCLLERHIAQKHPGVNECSEQDPAGPDGP